MFFLLYIAKSAGILSLFYVIYRFILNKDTFFTANRVFLLSGIIAAFLLPLLSFENIRYVVPPTIENITELSFDPTLFIDTPLQPDTIEAYTIDWQLIVTSIYSIGLLLFLLRLYIQISSVFHLIKSGSIVSKNRFTFIEVSSDINPFSFFKYIVYNPTKHTIDELEMILAHEQVHARQKHSIDILVTQIILSLQWFNPLAWGYKQSLEQNLEYLADNEAIQKTNNVKQYQHTLVKVSSTTHTLALTNPFYQSLIKKRIIMLNKPQSHKRNLWKLTLVLPLLACFMYSFNVKEVIEYVDEDVPAFAKAEKNLETNNKGRDIFYVNSNSTSDDLDRIESYVSEHWDHLTVQFDSRNFTTNGKLTGFIFQTRFNKNQEFTNRFSFDKKTRVDWKGYSLMVNNPNEIIVMEETDGSLFKITEKDIVIENRSFNVKTQEEGLNTQKEKNKGSGKNPVLIVNNKIIIDKAKKTRFTADSITTVLPKEAIKNYGLAASDGATVLHSAKMENEEKTKTSNLTNDLSKDNYVYKITKKTQDADLEALKKTLKEKHNALLKVKALRRNTNGEITGVGLYFTDVNGNYMSNIINSKTPINDIYIYKQADGSSGMGNYPFIDTNSSNLSQEMRRDINEQKAILLKRQDSLHKVRNILREERAKYLRNKGDSLREHHRERSNKRRTYVDSMRLKVALKQDSIRQSIKRQHTFYKNNKDKAIQENEEAGYIKLDNNTYYYVKKDNGSTTYYDRWGQEIDKNNNIYRRLTKAPYFYVHNENENDVKKRIESYNNINTLLQTIALYYIDGKKVSYKAVQKIDLNTIAKINVLKGEEATKAYGEEARNGVIVMQTK